MEDQVAVSNTILRTISESRTKTLAGGQIRDALNVSYPNFRPIEHGARNLREFIRMYVPAVKEESRAGMDIVYGLRDSSPKQLELSEIAQPDESSPTSPLLKPRSHLVGDQRIWKAFASPSSPWRLFLQPETGIVRSFAPNELSPDGSWVRIPSCSAEALLKIAHTFVDSAPEPFRPILTRPLTERKWWLPFFEVLRNVGLKSSWLTFRRERIADEFDRAISVLMQGWDNRITTSQESRQVLH